MMVIVKDSRYIWAEAKHGDYKWMKHIPSPEAFYLNHWNTHIHAAIQTQI